MYLFIQLYISDDISETHSPRQQMYVCDPVLAPWGRERCFGERPVLKGSQSSRGKAWPQIMTQKVRSTAPYDVHILGEETLRMIIIKAECGEMVEDEAGEVDEGCHEGSCWLN